MGRAPGRTTRVPPLVRFLALISLAVTQGCAIQQYTSRAARDQVQHERGADGPHNLEHPLEQARRENLLTQLHPAARALVEDHGLERLWARDAIVFPPNARCAQAVGFAAEHGLTCSLIALGDGQVAVLVLNDPRECQAETCLERSWVFVKTRSTPLQLPPRRLADYRGLRADHSSDRASALWIAGFRSYGDERHASGPADAPLRIADYATCTPAPDQRELVCRSGTGDVIALDPRVGAARLVAKLGIAFGELPLHALSPVSFTADGRMAVSVAEVHHPLCGADACELAGVVDWTRAGAAHVRLVRKDQLPW